MIDYKKLVDAGVHFGHKTSRWNPKMEPYIWGFRNSVHLIDVSKTAVQLEKAAQFLESVAAQNQCILWVGTKKAAQKVVEETAQELDDPCVVYRWIGGTFTNSSQVKKSRTKLMHLEDVIKKSDQSHYTKKELVSLQKMVDRLQRSVGNLRNLTWPIGAVVVVDVKKEQTAVREAASMGIPVVGLVDTNSDPSLVDYVIPCNDDAPKSIELILDYLAQAIKRGQQRASAKVQDDQAQQEVDEGETTKTVLLAEDDQESDVAEESVEKDQEREPSKTAKK